MISRIRKSIEEKDQGFTLIELLVVMIIIGILAAIAIPVFLNQRAKARDTSTKADVSTVGKEIATYYVDGTGTMTASIDEVGGAVTLESDDDTPYTATIDVSNGTDLNGITYVTGPKDTSWCVSLTNADGQLKDFKYSAEGGLEEGTCAPATP